ncbi:hypothetical protein SAMN00120144_0739 [Hymenobacter roseosalivarius DSM 11622]|uniref:Ceramidase n=1 Tax=Hymenobacter roseosalivarius DSM 11622 TaxID=645990 RepID=A0A1W1UR10_9BACT|nr:ceramidase domain-containing protein [Hymenobacter roseosalivarius]SMB83578.1 hypothetical protein SAMN00120144_0739 [Hymenobacter roseosalivarius DSM 11622]
MESHSCPWHEFDYSPAQFCEESLCGWVRQPGNTVSNLGFLVVAYLIFRHAKKHNARHLLPLAYISIATGLGSAFFHASETWVGGIADFSTIYLGSAFMFAMNVRRLTKWGKPAIVVVYWLFFLGFFGLLFWERDLARTSYALQSVLCCIVLEAILFFRQDYRPPYRWFWAFWGSFLLGYGLWLLDVKHIVCDPANHWVSGHALWHWLDALALYCVYRFYTGIPLLRFSPQPSVTEVGSRG